MGVRAECRLLTRDGKSGQMDIKAIELPPRSYWSGSSVAFELSASIRSLTVWLRELGKRVASTPSILGVVDNGLKALAKLLQEADVSFVVDTDRPNAALGSN